MSGIALPARYESDPMTGCLWQEQLCPIVLGILEDLLRRTLFHIFTVLIDSMRDVPHQLCVKKNV